MSKHTKGPWVHAGQFLVRLPKSTWGGGKYVGQLIARTRVRGIGLPTEEAVANARLISKAPDMYDLLNEIDEEDFVTTCADEGTYCNLCGGDMYRGYDHDKDCLYTRVQSVLKEINKA